MSQIGSHMSYRRTVAKYIHIYSSNAVPAFPHGCSKLRVCSNMKPYYEEGVGDDVTGQYLCTEVERKQDAENETCAVHGDLDLRRR